MLISIIPIFLFSPHSYVVRTHPDCFGELRSSLVAGGYTGGVDCRTIKVNIMKAGYILGKNKYQIYSLVYKTHTLSPHGGQRILVFHNQRYIGQYKLDTPPFYKIVADGSDIAVYSNNKMRYCGLTLEEYGKLCGNNIGGMIQETNKYVKIGEIRLSHDHLPGQITIQGSSIDFFK